MRYFEKSLENFKKRMYNRILVIFMIRETIKIALDGPSGSGKSTLAKNLAKKYGFVYIDTGALYRTIGLFVSERGIASDDADAIVALLPEIHIEMKLENGGGAVYLGDRLIGDEIRTPVCSKYASDVSKIPEVREFLLETQRSIARENNVIMDGRDIGTCVLVDAPLKIYLTASVETRGKRRYDELLQKGAECDFEAICRDIMERDERDMNREIAPLKQAEDAILVDSSDMTIEEVTDTIIKYAKERQ